MKFLALMGLAVIIQCASAAQEAERGLSSSCQTHAECQYERDNQRGLGMPDCRVCCPLNVLALETREETAQEGGALASSAESDAPNDSKQNEGLVADLGGLDDQTEDDMLTIVSDDGTCTLELKRKHVEMSLTLKNLLIGDIHSGVDEPLKLKPRAGSGPIVRKIFEYVVAHDGVAQPETELAKPIRSKMMSKIATYTGANGYSDARYIDGTGAKGLPTFDHAAATDTLAADISAAGKQELFEIILAVNYLNIKSLLHLGCAKIATVIKGQGPDIIKRILGDNDYGVIGGVPVQGARRRRLSKDDRSILSKMFGTTF